VFLSIDEPATGGWQTWKTVRSTSSDNFEVGEFTYRIYARGSNWNINWFSFVLDESGAKYSIETICNEGGYVTPAGKINVRNGASQKFTISTIGRAEITDVLLDGVSLGVVTEYTIENVTQNHQLEVVFESNVGI